MRVLFYCQHALGMGHYVRSMALAERLAGAGEVLFLNGGVPPDGIPCPPGVTRVDLVPLGMTETGDLISHAPGVTPEDALEIRRGVMMNRLREQRPDVLLVELFPFGRRKFAPELVPLLEEARRMGEVGEPAPLVVCSVRDLLVTGRVDQQRFDDRARLLCDRYLDLVLVHADPAMATFEESFRPTGPLRTPVAYTGFLTRPAPPVCDARSGVLVSAGGGVVGEGLYRAAVQAHRLTWPSTRLPTTIVAGPFAPPPVVAWLEDEARHTPGLIVHAHVPDLRPYLARAAVSVSQCGYNTALDIVSTRTPAVVVPFGDERENEQARRAQRLAALGLLRWLPSRELTVERLAAETRAALTFEPAPAGLRLDGAAETVRVLRAHLAARRVATIAEGA